MTHWVKIPEARQHYLIDLEQVTAFVCSKNGRLTLWLPDSRMPMVLTRGGNLGTYDRILTYAHALPKPNTMTPWFKLDYDRSIYIINLAKISSFCYGPGQKITFWLPDAGLPIVLTHHSNPASYTTLCQFIEQQTGERLEDGGEV
ncbi:hypothetical protein [Spirulina major]|uniref:hypothetical protein n=1 Tax=Spirulina major TaxID=270636 RepID=UPI0009335EED|nr:hypothetical protein [Spirulina major]